MALPIEDYAIIGDCETAALVGKDGSIDWLCWPAFSSGACFAALLGDANHGRWQIAPAADAPKVTRKYRDHTLILETTFEANDGTFTLIDFMPIRGRHSDIVRIVRGVKGRHGGPHGAGPAFRLRQNCPLGGALRRRPARDSRSGYGRLSHFGSIIAART